MWYSLKSPNMKPSLPTPVILKHPAKHLTPFYIVKKYPDYSIDCLLDKSQFTLDVVQFLLNDCTVFGFLKHKNAYWGHINYLCESVLYTVKFELQLLKKVGDSQTTPIPTTSQYSVPYLNIFNLYNIEISSSFEIPKSSMMKLTRQSNKSKHDRPNPTDIVYRLFKNEFCDNVYIINVSCE
jgi:hypothetical protein